MEDMMTGISDLAQNMSSFYGIDFSEILAKCINESTEDATDKDSTAVVNGSDEGGVPVGSYVLRDCNGQVSTYIKTIDELLKVSDMSPYVVGGDTYKNYKASASLLSSYWSGSHNSEYEYADEVEVGRTVFVNTAGGI